MGRRATSGRMPRPSPARWPMPRCRTSSPSSCPGVDVLFLDTGYHFAETRHTRDEVGRVLDVRIVDVLPEQTVAEQDAEFGAKLYSRDPGLCCARRKVAPLQDALGGYEVWFTGVRREEAPTRAEHAAGRVGRAQRARQGQSGRRVDLRRPARLRRRAPGAGQPPRDERLPLDRLRAVHASPSPPAKTPGPGRWAGLSKTECGLHL